MVTGCVYFDVRSQEAATAASRGSPTDVGQYGLWRQDDVHVTAVRQCAALDDYECRLHQTADAQPSAPTDVQETVFDDVCL